MNFKKILYIVIYYSGLNYIYSLFLNRKLFVVMYHSISSSENSDLLKQNLYKHVSINVDNFKKQIEYLKKKGHTFISFSDLRSLDFRKIKKPTIIYFDDGFKDILLNAVPILKKFNIPATVFVVTGILDHTQMLWTIFYREILERRGIDEMKQNLMIEDIKIKTDIERLKIMQEFNLNDYKYLFNIFMAWNDVRNIAQQGFEIGSHTVSHPRLNECTEDDLTIEIVNSRIRIEKEISRNIDTFSFPYGRGNVEILNKLKEAGYKYVVSKGKGINKITKSNPIYYLKNISPKPNDSLMMFKLKMYFLNIFS